MGGNETASEPSNWSRTQVIECLESVRVHSSSGCVSGKVSGQKWQSIGPKVAKYRAKSGKVLIASVGINSVGISSVGIAPVGIASVGIASVGIASGIPQDNRCLRRWS
jgi:hypothetical protein